MTSPIRIWSTMEIFFWVLLKLCFKFRDGHFSSKEYEALRSGGWIISPWTLLNSPRLHSCHHKCKNFVNPDSLTFTENHSYNCKMSRWNHQMSKYNQKVSWVNSNCQCEVKFSVLSNDDNDYTLSNLSRSIAVHMQILILLELKNLVQKDK